MPFASTQQSQRSCIAIAALLAVSALTGLANLAAASDADAINDLIGGGSETAAPAASNDSNSGGGDLPAISPNRAAGGAVADSEWDNAVPAGPEAYGHRVALPTDRGAATGADNKERWVRYAAPLRNIQLIAAAPRPGADCAEVIFRRSTAITRRFDTAAGQRIRLPLGKTCWIGLRNGSDQRTLVLRVGEAFQQLAINPSPQLVTGRELKPYEKLQIAIRPLSLDRLDVSFEATWTDKLDEGASIERMTLEFIGSNGQ